MRWAVLSAVLVAVAARLLHGPGVLGYDAVWALVWGDEIADLRQPSLTAAFAPTPHPLATIVSAALATLGPADAGTAILALSWLSLGVLAVALAWLGAELFGWPAGIAAAVVLCTRGQFAAEAAQAVVDVPFLALAVTAALVEVRRPRHRAVPVLLVLAGLLRPEGWALAAAYVVYRRDLRWLPLAAVAPVLWAGMDLWATGDLLHSLHGTQALGEALGRPTGSRTALTSAPQALRDIVQTPMLWVALAGAAAGLVLRERESVLPAAVVGVGLLGFMVLGVAGLPVLNRYLLLPGAMLILFAGLALGGFGRVATAVAAVVVAIGVPSDVDELRYVHGFTTERRAIQADLRRAVRSVDGRCGGVLLPDARTAAVVALYRRPPVTAAGGRAVFTATDPAVEGAYAIGESTPRLARGATRYRGRYFRVTTRRC